ncbi:MAG: uL15 family ribosomal protein [Candidatus Hermodarchaeota archaeon]
MTVRKPKRVRQHRGSRTHGYGRIGQHRKGGQRGGKGKTGGKKHDWTYVTAKTPDRFGKHGFHRHGKLRQSHNTINVGDIVRQLPRFTSGKPATKDAPITINLEEHGFDKVLGAGTISIPLTITAPIFTHRAAEKIKAAGGKIKGTIQEPTKHKAPSLKAKPKPKPKVAAKPKPKAKPKTATKPKPKSTTKTKSSTKKAKSKRATATKSKSKT